MWKHLNNKKEEVTQNSVGFLKLEFDKEREKIQVFSHAFVCVYDKNTAKRTATTVPLDDMN